ncbi:MAG: hypothetical protein ACOYNL_07910 [Rickettsiales bacterium]
MAFDGAEQAAIIELMHGKYGEILAIEIEWGIRLHEGDWRPRVEHFHDAVRALTSASADMYAKNSRLSVENLAYDLGQLRQIQSKPVGLINKVTEKSVSTEIVRASDAGAGVPRMPPQAVRAQITSLYKDYMVFFAALFAQVADDNFNARSQQMESTQNDLQLIEQVMKQLLSGKMNATQAMQELMHVERDDLRERLQGMLAKQSLTAGQKQEAQGMIGQIKTGLDAERKKLDTSHMHYATGQLAVYEASKETIKRMQSQGLNLAGKFVAQAVQAAGQGKGRSV